MVGGGPPAASRPPTSLLGQGLGSATLQAQFHPSLLLIGIALDCLPRCQSQQTTKAAWV